MDRVRNFGIVEFWCLGGEIKYLLKSPPELHTQPEGDLAGCRLCSCSLAVCVTWGNQVWNFQMLKCLGLGVGIRNV